MYLDGRQLRSFTNRGDFAVLGAAMWRAFCAIAFLLLGSVGSQSANSLYQTTSAPISGVGYGSNDSYIFVAPYFTEVQTLLSVSITKVAASGSSTTKSPAVLSAQTVPDPSGQTPGKVTLHVSCDLTSVLSDGDFVSLTQMQPQDWNVSGTVYSHTSNIVVVTLDKGKTLPSNSFKHGGSFSGVSCPPPGDTFNIAFTATPVGKTRGYLYLRRNAFFSDTVNIAVGSEMPSGVVLGFGVTRSPVG